MEKFKESRNEKMEKLNYTKFNGKKYALPEGYYAIEKRFGDQVYRDDNGKNVSQQIMSGAQIEDVILLTDQSVEKLELLA